MPALVSVVGAHNLHWHWRIRQVPYGKIGCCGLDRKYDWEREKKTKGNEAETHNGCNDKKSQTNIAMRMVNIRCCPSNIFRSMYEAFLLRVSNFSSNSFGAWVELNLLHPSKRWFFHIQIFRCCLGCKCCDCHLRRPTVIFYFSLFLAVQNFECFGIILTDK